MSTITQLPTIAVAADATSPSHPCVDVVEVLRGTEVVEAKGKKKKNTKPWKQRGNSLSSNCGDHDSLHGTNSHHRYKTPGTVAGNAANSGNFLSGTIRRALRNPLAEDSSGGRSLSPPPPKRENAQPKQYNTNDNTPLHTQRLPGDDSSTSGLSSNVQHPAKSQDNPLPEQEQQEQRLQPQHHVPVTATADASSRTSTSPKTVPTAASAMQENPGKAAELELSGSEASADHSAYHLFVPFSTVEGTSSDMPPAPPPPPQKQQQAQEKRSNEYGVQAHASPRQAQSAQVELSEQAPKPETLCEPPEMPGQRMKAGTPRSLQPAPPQQKQQQSMSHARRPQQSMDEWNLHVGRYDVDGGVMIEGEAPRVEDGETRRNNAKRRGPRKSLTVLVRDVDGEGEDNAEEVPLWTTARDCGAGKGSVADSQHFRDYRFPSIFRNASRVTSSSQSFAFLSGVRQSTFICGLGDSAPSVVWQPSFINYSSADTDETVGSVASAANSNKGSSGDMAGDFMLPKPSAYSRYGTKGTGDAMYSFFSSSNIPPSAFIWSGKKKGEKVESAPKGNTTTVKDALPFVQGRVKVLSLQPVAPMSDTDDDDDDENKGTNCEKQVEDAKTRNEKPLSSTADNQFRNSSGVLYNTPLSPPSARPIERPNSFFVTRGGSLPQLASMPSKRNGDFWREPRHAEREHNDVESIGKAVDSLECSLYSSDSEHLVGLSRKATMHARKWWEEVFRGGVPGNGKINQHHEKRSASSGEDLPTSFYTTSHKLHRRRHHNAGDETTSLYSSSNSSSSSHSGSSSISKTSGSGSGESKTNESSSDDDDATGTHANGAELQCTPSEAEQLTAVAEEDEEEEYVRAYPAAPTPPPSTPSAKPSFDAPSSAASAGARYVGRPINRQLFRQPPVQQQQQQQRRNHRYRRPMPAIAVCVFPQPGLGDDNNSMTDTGVAVRVDAPDGYQIPHSPPHQAFPSTPNSVASPNSRGVPCQQMTAEQQRMKLLLGFDAEAEIRWVRSPRWSCLSPD